VSLLYFSPQTLHAPAGKYILLGIGVMLGGLMLVTWAGLQKESQSAKRDDTSVGHDVRYAKAQHNCVVWVLMAVLAGILSAGLNFSFAFGHSVAATMASERSDSVCWEHQWDGSLCK
jgi:drug/metabolite transporter (DMT)-like permease